MEHLRFVKAFVHNVVQFALIRVHKLGTNCPFESVAPEQVLSETDTGLFCKLRTGISCW